MGKTKRIAKLALDTVYIAVVVGVLGVALWAYLHFIHSGQIETFTVELYGETYQMLAPQWLALGLAIPVVWLLRKWSLSDLPWLQSLISVTLRSLLILALCLGLTRIVRTNYDSKICTVLVVDVSRSVPQSLLDQIEQYVQEVNTNRGQNAVRLVTFAREAREVALESNGNVDFEIERFEEEALGLESNLGPALRLAYGLFPQNHLRRIVVMSDGNLNRGDLLAEIHEAGRFGVQLYLKEFDYQQPDEVLIHSVDVPDGIEVSEPFDVTIDLFSTYEGEVEIEIDLGEGFTAQTFDFNVQPDEIVHHRARLEVSYPGERLMTFELDAERDTFDDNNQYEYIVDVPGRPQVLYIEGESRQSQYLERALDDERNSQVDFDLEPRNENGFPDDLDEMLRYDLIMLSDVEAGDISRSAMRNLREYVRDYGGSFIMIGGEDSFGPGGYQGTIMEEILPVTFEAQRNESMPSVALVLVIDRSGSMDGLPLEMAKDAARAVVEMLAPHDRIGVIAFDDNPHTVVRLQRASNRIRIESDIARISSGGGTDIYPALEEAYFELLDSSARTKHVILLSDGEAPTEGISDLVRDMRSDDISVSTIALGSGADTSLLEMIADLSNGHFYQTDDADHIPQLFVQDASQVTRSSIVEEPFRPVEVSSSEATRRIDFTEVPYLLGYISTRPRRSATVGLETDLGEPLYAYWRFGRGLTAVFTSDCKNRWMTEWIGESVYRRFWAQVVHHLMREQDDEDETLDMDVFVRDGRGGVTIDVFGDDGSFINAIVSTLHVSGPNGEEFEVPLEQTAAGRYEATFDVPTYGSYQLEAEHTLNGEPYAVSTATLPNPYPDEYLVVGANYASLRQAITLGGGQINPEIVELFDPQGEKIAFEEDLWPYFLFAALGLLLLDVLMRRVRLYGKTALEWSAVTRG